MSALLFVFVAWPVAARADDQVADKFAQEFSATIQPLLNRYCFECHAEDLTEADIDLAAMESPADLQKQTAVWIKVRRMLLSGQMPPPDADQPSDAELATLQTWVHGFLRQQAAANAGDPGPVILRRLTNAEYNYTIGDLTGINSLDPTREFPVDGAAGEGFTNSGSAQGMSPALVQKYLDAAKEVAQHVVLLPQGIRFSPYTSARDQTDELLARIQAIYRQFTEDVGGTAVDLQGIKFETNQGGRLPLQKYLAATIELRDRHESIDIVAKRRGLNTKYLTTVWQTLSEQPQNRSVLLDSLRRRWRHENDAAALTAEFTAWQNALWKFNSIGQIGRKGAAKSWMEAVSPIESKQELKHEFSDSPPDNAVIYLAVNSLGGGDKQDVVVWQHPRIEFSDGRPPLLLRDIRQIASRVLPVFDRESNRTTEYLDAVAKGNAPDNLNPLLLARWKALASLQSRVQRVPTGHLKNKVTKAYGFEAINGWSDDDAISLVTNRSDQPISYLTLTAPARGVTVHPAPTKDVVVIWSSPIDGQVRLDGLAADVDNVCGNGVAWRLELLSTTEKNEVASGAFDNGGRQRLIVEESVPVHRGDLISLAINARDQSHTCDATHIELKISEVGGEERVWDLARDVVDKVHEGNPLADSYGHQQTWHFCDTADHGEAALLIPIRSVLAAWRAAVIESKPAEVVDRLAGEVQKALTAAATDGLSDPDKKLHQLARQWNGPLGWIEVSADAPTTGESDFGIDSTLFGKHPDGAGLDEADLCLRVPHVIEVRLPGAMVTGGQFVADGLLHADSDAGGGVQFQLSSTKPSAMINPALPMIVGAGGQTQLEAALAELRELFPPALCYSRIVPVDEVVTLILFYREDDYLQRLMLSDRQKIELDRLWEELYFVSQEPIKLTVALEQLYAFATQDRADLVPRFAAQKKPINDRADAFRQQLLDSEPSHLDAILKFANQAWRGKLTESDANSLRRLYQRLRDSELPHAEAIRLTLARVLTSPAFLYKLEQPPAGAEAAAVSELELATRLSYFLWSSMPDTELRAVAESGNLRQEIIPQTRRMLADRRTQRLAVQFACQWLHLRDFDQNDDKNEKLYPEFATLRHAMYEETVRFFADMFGRDGSILDLLEADHTFVNEQLAQHYGLDLGRLVSSRPASDLGQISSTVTWQRVDGIRAQGRGGILGMATFLASQSGASRTSPILRGNWIYETLLGERLPRPPANVPQLPDAVPSGLTARQLIEQHSSVAECAKCHGRIDPYGFALEQYDAIGRLRRQPVDTKTTLFHGEAIEGIEGLRRYLLEQRHDDVIRQFCRKLLGFSLGREVMLSDEPLLDKMTSELSEHEYRFSIAVETIVQSDQFQRIRGSQNRE